MNKLKLIECPRDAMQGWHDFIPTSTKIDYINHLFECGFDTLDFGSFVSPKAIPQMRDTAEVLEGLIRNEKTKLLAIVANERGAQDACQFDEIDYLGYPFSLSETFQKRNTNATMDESLIRLEGIQNETIKAGKELVVYLSMGFGNPYGDNWHPDIVSTWSELLYKQLDIQTLALSDTIGCATEEIVTDLFSGIIQELPNIEFGAHLHVVPEMAKKIVSAAYQAGCRRFDGAIKGFGGCPMAKDDLTGNMPTEVMLDYFNSESIEHGINQEPFMKAEAMAGKIFI
jgi:hydroxymethylglutaryl-CoA lyase